MPVDDDLHATLEAAWDQHSEEAAPEPAPAPAPSAVEASDDPAPPDDTPTPAEKGRDERGRFASKPTALAAKVKPAPASSAVPSAQGAPAATTTTAPTTAPAVPAVKPPQSWKPAAREKWASLPPDIQAEVSRREKETATALAQRAEAVKFQQAVNQALTPYNHIIAADGGDPFRTVGALFQERAILRHGSMSDKAGLVARLVRDHGVDIDALAAAIDGQPAPTQQPQPQFQDPRFDKFLSDLQAVQAQQWETTRAKARADVEAFAETHEFLDDVRDDMYTYMAVQDRRGVDCTLEQAYNWAVKLNPELSSVMEQREAAKTAANAQASTQRAKVAASSVKGQSAVGAPVKPAGDSLRGAIEAAWEQHTGR